MATLEAVDYNPFEGSKNPFGNQTEKPRKAELEAIEYNPFEGGVSPFQRQEQLKRTSNDNPVLQTKGQNWQMGPDGENNDKPISTLQFGEKDAPYVDPDTFVEKRKFFGEGGKDLIKNIPGSAANFVKDISNVVMHPIDSGKAIGGLAVGFGQTFIPGEQAQEKYPRAFLENIGERYGSFDRFKKSAYDDPVGVALDIATLATGAGGVAKGVASNTGKLAKVGKTLTAVGETIDPLNAIKKATTATVKLIPKAIPEKIYERVAKMPTALPMKDRINAIKTALKEGIEPTPKGVQKLWDNVNSLERDIASTISKGKDKYVRTENVIKSIDSVKDYFKEYPVAGKYLKQIDEIEAGFKQERGPRIPVEDAQKIKKKTYEVFQKAYNEIGTVEKETSKAIAKGINTELKTMFPEIKSLLGKQSDLLGLNKAIKNAVGRIGKRDLIQLGAIGTGAGFGAASGSPAVGITAALLRNIISAPKVQAKLAIALRKGKNKSVFDAKVKGSKQRLALAQAGRAKENNNKGKIKFLQKKIDILNKKPTKANLKLIEKYESNLKNLNK